MGIVNEVSFGIECVLRHSRTGMLMSYNAVLIYKLVIILISQGFIIESGKNCNDFLQDRFTLL